MVLKIFFGLEGGCWMLIIEDMTINGKINDKNCQILEIQFDF